MHTELEQKMPQKCNENSKNVIHHYFKKSKKKETFFNEFWNQESSEYGQSQSE